MAKRRTKEQKIIARLREGVKTTAFYQPELSLPTSLVWADLTRTIIVTILALILQFSLAWYLQRGGWEIVKAKLLFFLPIN